MKIIGHRGAKGLAPENTLRAFEKALEHKVDEIELDVRVTSDGLVVLSHDPVVHDRAGNEVEVLTHTLEELRRHKPDLATLDDALTLIDRKVPVLIEIKPKVAVEPIVKILREFRAKGWAANELLPGSFDQKVLRRVHKQMPDAPLVVIERWSGVRAALRARQVHTKRLNMRSWWLWSGFLRPMHRRGWQIAPYTMNDPAKVHKWRPYLYAVITDFPDLFEK